MWRHADFSWMGLTGGQLYALPMILIGVIGIVYCATRPGPRTEVGPRLAGAQPPARDRRTAAANDIARCAARSTRSCARCGRDPGSRDAGRHRQAASRSRRIAAAIAAGLTDLGENYLQEAQRQVSGAAAGAQALRRPSANE